MNNDNTDKSEEIIVKVSMDDSSWSLPMTMMAICVIYLLFGGAGEYPSIAHSLQVAAHNFAEAGK